MTFSSSPSLPLQISVLFSPAHSLAHSLFANCVRARVVQSKNLSGLRSPSHGQTRSLSGGGGSLFSVFPVASPTASLIR